MEGEGRTAQWLTSADQGRKSSVENKDETRLAELVIRTRKTN